MKIIDFARKGNVIRFYLGEKTADYGWTDGVAYKAFDRCSASKIYSDTYYGDDWDDRPYEHNAGEVYERFIKGYTDLKVPFDCLVLEPCDGTINSSYSKNDMVARKIPCIIIVPESVCNELYNSWSVDFQSCLNRSDVIKIYLGDDEDVLQIDWADYNKL